VRPVTITARGHINVRARHPKTIELTADVDVTPRGTCIVGVAAELDRQGLVGLDGPVVVTLTCGHASDAVRGMANPRYDPGSGRLVIRRSHHRAPDTLVVDADRGSADLDRALVAALARDDAELRVDIAPDPDSPHHTPRTWDVDLAAVQDAALRVGGGAPVTFAGPLPRRATDRRRALTSAPDSITIWQVRPQDVAAVAAEAGDRLVATVTDPATPDEVVHDAVARSPVRAKTAFLVVRAPSTPSADDALLAALRDAGVPAKTLQDALVRATGMSKRDAYTRIVDPA
jgi:hypothetical protein